MRTRVGASVVSAALSVIAVGAIGCGGTCDVSCGPFGVYVAVEETLAAAAVEVCANGDCAVVAIDPEVRGEPVAVELPLEFIEQEPLLEISVVDDNGRSLAELSTRESGARRGECSCAGYSFRVGADGGFRRDR